MNNYRSEIDGLRALAIVPVLFFHAGFKTFSGGFIGVDVFFVISGYLITRIIIQEINEKKFNLLNFYERRARRILPNLFFVIIISSILAWLYLDIYSLNSFGKSLIGIATFTSNFYFWLKTGYFSETTELIPLMHSWSLSVEEQFYLFFPILMIYLCKNYNYNKFKILLTLTLCSLCVSIYSINYIDPIHKNIISGAFYLLPTRSWELGIGALIAIKSVEKIKNLNLSSLLIFCLELLGIFMIAFPIFLYDKNTPFPGYASIFPVFGTGIIIIFSTSKTIFGKFLSNKILVFIGVISYSLYLWHQVVFSFWRNTHLNLNINILIQSLLILLTFLLSYLTYKFIEKPFRNKNFLTQKKIFKYSLISLIFITVIGLFSISASLDIEELSAKKLTNSNYIYFQNIDERKFMQYRLAFETMKVEVLVMGSSRLMQLGANSFGKSTLNLSVSGASIEDYVALLPESINKFKPSEVYIGADPWLFNKNSEESRWVSVKEMYFYWEKVLNKKKQDSSLFLNNFNLQTHQNYFTLLYNKLNQNNSLNTNNQVEDISKKSKDGLCIYDRNYSNQSQDQIKRNFPNILSYSMNNYQFDKNAKDSFIRLIKFLKEKNIKIFLVLTPYHPDFFNYLKKNKSIIPQFENDFIEIGNSLNIKILGSYDVSKISTKFSSIDFYDGMHPKDTVMKFIVKQ